MPVLKRRPRVSLLAPRSIEIGQDAVLRALIDCAAPVTVRGIDLEVVGREVWLTASQYGEQRNTSDFHRTGAILFGGGELAPGRRELAVTLRLPDGLPGSYRGKRIHVEYAATVRVDIPWWRDAVEVFELHVSDGSSATDARPAILYSSAEGPVGRGPYLELSLPSTELAPGARLEVAASFSNVEHNRYRRLDLDLVALETTRGFLGGGTTERRASRWVCELGSLRDGEPFRTRIGLPDDLVPAFDLERIRLAWLLRASARVAWGMDAVVELPVTVHGRAARSLEVRAPPEVGSERVAALWRAVGEESGLGLEGGVLAGPVGAARVAIWRELSGRRGPLLVGEIRFPDLRIGLRLEGRRRTPAARDPRHAELLAERLAGALSDAGAESASDRQIRCASRASGARRGPLLSFVGAVVALARELAETRAALPPPARLADELGAWRAAAAALGARFEAAGPSLAGTGDGLPFEMGLVWSDADEPDAIELAVTAPAPIDTRHHLCWNEWDAAPDHEAIAPLCELARSLEIDRTAVRAVYPHAVGPERAAAQLPLVAALVRQLCAPPGGGAYR